MHDLIYNLEHVGLCYRRAAALPWKSSKFWALRDVSFKVYHGETLGIIGRNGAGKTTLLKILAGIIKPDVGAMSSVKIKVLMQSLGAGFDKRLTGRQNIYLNGLLLGMDKRQIQKQEQAILELADIGEFIDEPVKTYSSGMRARLGFSIAYYVDTDVMLIDEALSVGDRAFNEKASVLIKEKIKSDRTVVLVTHSVETVKELCDRVIHIENGCSLEEMGVDESIKRYLSINKKR